MMTNNSHSNLTKLVILTGFMAFALSIVNTIQFYSTLGHTSIGIGSYVTAGVLLTTLAVLSNTLAAYMFKLGHVIVSLFLVVMFVILLGLEIFTEFGFLATQQETKSLQVAKDSEPAQMAKFSVELAEKELQRLAEHANVDVSSLEGQKNAIESRLSSLQAQLQACPANYISKCINPLKNEIAETTKKLLPIEIALRNSGQYQAALNNKERAMNDYSTVSTGQGVQMAMSPVYIWAARLTGYDAKDIQVGTSLLISVLLAIWAAFSGFIVLILSSHNETTEQRVSTENEATQPAQSVGFIPHDFKVTPATAKKEGKQPTNGSLSAQSLTNGLTNDLTNGLSVTNGLTNGTTIKKAVGGTYQCEDCGTDYTARTVWQKRCPACTAKKRASYKVRKKASV